MSFSDLVTVPANPANLDRNQLEVNIPSEKHCPRWIDLGVWNAATGFLLPDPDENSGISEVFSSCDFLIETKTEMVISLTFTLAH